MTKKKGGKHGAVRGAVDKVVDTLGGVAGKINAALVTSADSFVEHVALGDMYEIEAAKVALGRASSSEVRSVAQEMIDDHTTSTHQMLASLEMNETRGVSAPPSKLDSRHSKMLEHLRSATKDRFDSTYLDQQVSAHEETLSLLTSYRDKGDNAQLRSLAAGAAPVVRRHLQRVKALAVEMAH